MFPIGILKTRITNFCFEKLKQLLFNVTGNYDEVSLGYMEFLLVFLHSYN